jgi:hypothetical protein
MSRQTAVTTTTADLASPPPALRRTAFDGVLHRDVKRVIVVVIRLCVLQRAFVFCSPITLIRKLLNGIKVCIEKEKEIKRTAFEPLEPFLHIFFAALALLELLELHLLTDLLAFSLAPPRLALCDARALVEQTLSDAFHVRVRLDHFCEKVIWPREGEAVLCGESTGGLCAMQSLFVAT